MNYGKLKGKIREVYGTQTAFAAAMGRSVCVINQKLNNKAEWTAKDIRKATELLGITVEEIPTYFFNLKIEKSQQM